MTSAIQMGFLGYHLRTDLAQFDKYLPVSTSKAAHFFNNAGHLHDARMPYLVNCYGVGVSVSSGGIGRYIRSFQVPLTMAAGGKFAHLDCMVAVGTLAGGSLATTLRVVPVDAPYPATDDYALASLAGSASTSSTGEWVIDDVVEVTSRPVEGDPCPSLDGDGTHRGAAKIFRARVDIEVILSGGSGSNYFGVAGVQIRECAYTP